MHNERRRALHLRCSRLLLSAGLLSAGLLRVELCSVRVSVWRSQDGRKNIAAHQLGTRRLEGSSLDWLGEGVAGVARRATVRAWRRASHRAGAELQGRSGILWGGGRNPRGDAWVARAQCALWRLCSFYCVRFVSEHANMVKLERFASQFCG